MRFCWLLHRRRIRRVALLVCFLTILVVWRSHTWIHNPPKLEPVSVNEAASSADLTYLITNELRSLLREDIPVVEDVGEAYMEDWFKREQEFCTTNADGDGSFPSPECYNACNQSEQMLGVPKQQRRNLIVIPFRDRHFHLGLLLPRIKYLLRRQNVCHLILIAEQLDTHPFNKGVLMNAAFVHAVNWFPFHCVTFHDVDLLPLSNETPYKCPTFPRHTSVFIDKFESRLPYVELIGGILSLPVKAFLRVNGFSNLYWGWGAEDDDMFIRLTENRIPITRADINVSRFHMLPHKPSPAFSEHLRARILALAKSLYRLDGLNSLNFTIIEENVYSFERPFIVPQAHNSSATTQIRAEVAETIYPVLHLRINVGTPPNWLRSIGGTV